MRIDRRRFVGSMVALPAALAGAAPALSHHQVRQPAVLARQTADAVHGINPADMDFSVSPREDFYRFANGGWLDRTEIPPNRGWYGVTTEIHDRTTRQLIGLLDNLAASDVLEEGSDEWKAIGFYQQGTDLETRNRLGLSPLASRFEEISQMADRESLHDVFQRSKWRVSEVLFSFDVFADMMDSSVNALYLYGPTLGLPNRDFYLDDSPDYEDVRRAYLTTGAALLGHVGYDGAQAEQAVGEVFSFERELAAKTLTREERQDFGLIYNPMTLEELGDAYPLMDWAGFFETNGLTEVTQVIVTEPGYISALGNIMEQTPIEVIRDFFTLRTIWSYSAFLSEEIEATAFAYVAALDGVSNQLPIKERVLGRVGGSMGLPHAVSKLYVSAYFPPEAKARITEMVDMVKVAFQHRLERNEWMTELTKSNALKKLFNLDVRVGYPDTWQSYEDVELGDSYAGTAMNAAAAYRTHTLQKYGKPVDRGEWSMQPHVVNAEINLVTNTMFFPAGILQPPFFDHQADPASNFGAFGTTIGHEITHAFDMMGSQFDAYGNLVDWWTDQDREGFGELNERVVEQYNEIEMLPGLRVNGQITVGENVADLGGVQVAWDALSEFLAQHGFDVSDVLHGPVSGVPSGSSPVATLVAEFATPPAEGAVASPTSLQRVERLTQADRYFIAAATAWREKIRDESLRTQIQDDVHAPNEVRAVWPLLNMDAFHETFGTRPGDAMYLAPEDRIVIW